MPRLSLGRIEAGRHRLGRAGRTGGKVASPRAVAELREVEDRIRSIRVADPRGVAQVLSLAAVLDPDGRLAACPRDVRSRCSPTSSI